MDIEHVRSRFIKHFDGTTGFINNKNMYLERNGG